MRGIGNILFGVVAIIGGLTGSLVLRGTGSSAALAVAGVVFVIIGFVQAASGASGNTSGHSAEEEQALADSERDAEQMAEYEKSKRELAYKQAAAEEAAKQQAELDRLLQSPSIKQQVDELMAKAGPHLTKAEQRKLALETARRMSGPDHS